MAKKSKSVAAEPAASGPVGEQNANTTEVSVQEPKPATGTTTALFGEQQPIQEPDQPAPVQEEKKEEVAQPEPSPAEPQPEEFYLEDVLSKYNIPLDKVKSRIKVDGKEEVISFDEYKKRVQLKTHLDQAGQELGRQRREILELRKGIEKERTPISQVPAQADPTANRVPSDDYISVLEQRLAAIEARTAPVVYDANRQQLARELKNQGFDDFLDYLPRIEAEISKIQDPNAQVYYDTPEGATQLFLKLKNQDLMEQLKQKSDAPKPAPLERPKPPIQKIDGGSQPTTVNDIDDWQAKRDELYTRWMNTHEPNAKRKALHELMRHQNVLSFK